jgi:hypothetical protein
MQSAQREFLELEMFVKHLCLWIDGVNQYRSRAGDFRCRGDTVESVFQEGATYTTSLLVTVNRQARQRRRFTAVTQASSSGFKTSLAAV